jgi:16S rRNA (adenine1518-N6/adenine1519-N6)-dimethyltransferase
MSGPHRARKRFGQNFLVDQRVIDRIIQTLRPQPDELLVEIGPGHGALTEALLELGAELIVIELDRDLAAALQQRHAGSERLQIIQADALKVDLSALAEKPFRLIGNLPYNISSPLLFHFAEHQGSCVDAHLMLQREVAVRLAASPGDSSFSRLSVMMSLYAVTESLFDVPAEAFQPQPKVVSSIVRLQPRQPEIADNESRRAFSRFVQQAFGQRRKTLANNLRGWLDREAITALDIDPGIRPQQLGLAEYLRLFDVWRLQTDNKLSSPA